MEITPEIQALLDEQAEKLKVEFEASVKGLKENQAALLEEKQERQRVLDAAKAEAEAKALEAAKASKDIDSVTASYEDKLKALQAELDSMNADNLAKTKSQIASDFLTQYGTGSQLALDAMKREYEARIDVRDGKTVVLDAGGNLTALSIEDLNKEFISNSRYAENIKGTQATGGGASGSKGGGRAVDLSKMTATEEAQFANQNPELYAQMIGN